MRTSACIIARKAASQKGVSILIALVFVLICTVVAVVVISSASVNAERMKNYRIEQQSYLAKVSAINLAQGIIVGDNDDKTDGIRIKREGTGDSATYSVVAADDLGIAQWMCARANGSPSLAKYTMEVDASALNSVCEAEVGAVTLEVSFNGSDVRVRAYDALDGTASSKGAVNNISRTFSSNDESGVMNWYLAGVAE